MSNELEAREKSLLKIFDGSDYPSFKIPSYQRPYSWSEEQCEELFDDIIGAKENSDTESYFLGSIVLIKNGTSDFSVVDGQQRLVSISLLLAVLSAADESIKTKYLYQEEDIYAQTKSAMRITMRQKDKECYSKLIKENDLNHAESDSQQHLINNYKYFEQLVNDKCKCPDEFKELAIFLMQQVCLVSIVSTSKQKAFEIFNVLNTRGLPLTTADILKAKIVEEDEALNEKWEALSDSLGENNFNELFSHIRFISKKEKARASILEELEQVITDELKVFEREVYFDSYIKELGEVFAKVLQGCKGDDQYKNYFEIFKYISWSEWVAPVLLFFKKFVSQEDRTEFLRMLDIRLAYTVLCGKTLNDRYKYFGSLLRIIEKSTSVSSDLVTVLILCSTEKEELLNVLSEDVYSDFRKLSSERIKYLFARLTYFISDEPKSLPTKANLTKRNNFTIEHVLPQNPSKDTWQEFNDIERRNWVGKIANLIILSGKMNSSAQNYEFKDKKEKYFQGKVSPYSISTQIVNENEWSPKVLERRQNFLLKLLSDEWGLDY